MTKYAILLNVLDELRREAGSGAHSAIYNPDGSDTEAVNQARARAFIHLYIKVSFGLTDFLVRERCITDGGYDGGIGGYYIQSETRVIFLIQSKFRTTERNFETKPISFDEILSMDINRILSGEKHDESGNAYNGKILGLQRSISSIPDIGRYTYQVVLLANLPNVSMPKLTRLTQGHPVELIDFERCYLDLVFRSCPERISNLLI